VSGRQNKPCNLELAYVAAHLSLEAAAEPGFAELANDLAAIATHANQLAADELAAFHRSHDVTRAAAPAPAWWTKGGAA